MLYYHSLQPFLFGAWWARLLRPAKGPERLFGGAREVGKWQEAHPWSICWQKTDLKIE